VFHFLSQSLPNQVNDFNDCLPLPQSRRPGCRNPFQTRSTTSIRGGRGRPALGFLSQSLPNQVNDFNKINGFSRFVSTIVSQSLPNQVNDFNSQRAQRRDRRVDVAIPSKPGQRLQSFDWEVRSPRSTVSQSLPNQVNDFNFGEHITTREKTFCRNPFQTRSTTSII